MGCIGGNVGLANMVEKRSIRAEGTKEGRRYLSPEREGRKDLRKEGETIVQMTEQQIGGC